METIPLGNAKTIITDLKYLDPATKGQAKWVGSPVTIRISETENGNSIDPALLQNMVEVADGRYAYTFSSAVIDQYLTPYVDQIVYIIVRAGPANEYQGSTPVLVEAARAV